MPRNITHSLNHRISIVLFTLLFSVIAACSSGNEEKSVTGEITAVEARSIAEFESLTLVDEDGRVWEFVGGAFAGFTPSHLREHMALGDPVKVWYVEVGDEMRVTRIEDG